MREPIQYWLMKSEPAELGIDDLAAAPARTLAWTGVRNYQARNFMRDGMRVGDLAFFYHSSCAIPGIAGIVKIVAPAYADPLQFDPASEYFDAKSIAERPRWVSVDVELVDITRLLPLTELRSYPELAGMRLLAKGNRLSVLPVQKNEWDFIGKRLQRG
jgi:predicted RNA-binding protein with PUA-like domain